ncbi:hypothetical protein KC976_01995 [Candidatus Saccharibacteria bacterium]|nr:hypothetical protein [Candidatus Saccharibacteria bacterium]HPG37187.1 hypothetical protein [Candidatus Saccharibacteria bacterium]
MNDLDQVRLPLSDRQVGLLIRRGLGCVAHEQNHNSLSGSVYTLSIPEDWSCVDIKRHGQGYSRTLFRENEVIGFTHIVDRKWRFKLYQR